MAISMVYMYHSFFPAEEEKLANTVADPVEKSGAETIGNDEPTILEALEKAASAVGVEIRYDKLATGDVKTTSGACRIRGVDTIIIDRRLGPKEKTAALARELSRYNFDNIYLPPAARELLEASIPKSGGGKK